MKNPRVEAALAAGFGVLLIAWGVRAIVRERRVARRNRRPVRPDLVAGCTFLFVLGALSLLLGAAIAWVFPR